MHSGRIDLSPAPDSNVPAHRTARTLRFALTPGRFSVIIARAISGDFQLEEDLMTTIRTLLFGLSSLVFLLACTSGKKPAPRSAAAETDAMLTNHGQRGKVVLVEFGMVGCELSAQGLDSMAAWKQRNAIPGLEYLRLDRTGNSKKAKDYFTGKSLPFPIVVDTSSAIARALGTSVYPTFILLDRFARIRYRGSLPSQSSLNEWVKKLAAEPADLGPKAPLFGAAAPDHKTLLAQTRLPGLTGLKLSLAEYSGPSGLLLMFVDTKCPFSAQASQEVPGVAAGMGRQGVASVLVNIGDPVAEVRKKYAGLAGASVVYDTTRQTQKEWDVQFVPLVVLLDAAGQILYRGSPTWNDLAAAAEKGLNLPKGTIRFEAEGTNQG
jgi:hypothetical protein